MTEEQNIIDLRQIVKRFYVGQPNELEILHNIDLQVKKGEFVSIVGASGSGKTTLMNIIGVLDRPTRGAYTLDGVDVAGAKDKELSGMTCNCTEAVEYQKEKQRKEKAMMNVSALFGENAAPDKRCGEGIVNILKAAVEEIYTGGLAKVTLNLRGGVKASISQNAKGEINVERTETKKQKLTE